MSGPLAVVLGAGRVGAGHVAPMLRAAGWDVVLVGRDPAAARALRGGGRILLDVVAGGGTRTRVVDGVDGRTTGDRDLAALVRRADLVAVSVGAGALPAVGRVLAPLLLHRLLETGRPVNVVAFENHRRAAETLADAVLAAESVLATAVNRLLGIAGAVVWRVASHRAVTADGLRLRVDDVAGTFVDRRCLVPGTAPLDDPVPGLELVEPFDTWMTDKLWVFNAGHAAAAYLGGLAGAQTLAEAMDVPWVAHTVEQVLHEARHALAAQHPAGAEATTVAECLARYRDPALADPVARVAREPRRKLAPGDRILGPAVAATGAGLTPVALATTAAAALLHDDPRDPQARGLRTEVERDGVAEVLATVGGLDPTDELSRLVVRAYDDLRAGGLAGVAAHATRRAG